MMNSSQISRNHAGNFTIRGIFLALCFFLLTTSGRAIEAHIGTVRITTEVTCLNHCDDYYLEPDTGSTIYRLRGLDLALYVGRHVQVFGYRSYCGSCLVITVTSVVRLPLTDVELVDDRLPQSTQLLQNYPNPFNPTTTIRYNLAAHGDVSVKVYTILGTEVATLVRASQAPGTYAVTWNAAEFPSGLYFCRLQTTGAVFTRKMNFMK